MTTMDSDSESQDSDEGRRFRFEATRKDSVAGLHSRKRRSSSVRRDANRRSRSIDRNNRDRKNSERPRHDHKKISRSSLHVKRPVDGDAKHSKEVGESTRGASNYKDSRDSRSSLNSSSNHKESKISRESPLKNSRKELRTRERDRRRPSERSTVRNFDEKQLNKHINKSGVRKSRHSRERSRERSHQGSKSKSVVESARSHDEVYRTDFTRKISRKYKEEKNVKVTERNVKETNALSESDSNSRAWSPSSRAECKDLNLSDFDIVSDIEEDFLDSSSSRRRTDESTRSRDESSLPRESESGIKKRVSKRQYERLLKRQAVKNRRSLEELHKVKEENGDHTPGTSNNNRSAISDFLLGTAVETTTVAESPMNSVDDSIVCRKDTNQWNSNKDASESNSENSQSISSTYRPILVPKTAKISSLHRERKNDKEASRSNEKEKATPRVIGPSLPAHLRQCVADDEIEAEDTFGPALPPHLEQQHKDIDKDSEDDTGVPVLSDNVSEKDESTEVDREQSEADDIDMMGPLPSDHPALANDIVQQQLELRARRLKAELAACDLEDEKKREEWMTELPEVQTVHLGLGPRKFRVRPAPDMSDRSSWTDTPADKARKHMEKVCLPTAISREQDVSNVSSEAGKSRKLQKSLLEIHQKKLQKKKKKEEKEANKIGKKVERRPFDRDLDLQANRFDEARKKRMVMKSQELDDRFLRGKI